jgi:hypothetical protein
MLMSRSHLRSYDLAGLVWALSLTFIQVPLVVLVLSILRTMDLRVVAAYPKPESALGREKEEMDI